MKKEIYTLHISDFVDNETFEQILFEHGIERTEENDYQFMEIILVKAK